ncbi:MAG: LysR family transcriptional regulator [Bdellovibrionales bacterium]|nr:LysR family transcriptional regulator [Bdellovibrionales bacterium]
MAKDLNVDQLKKLWILDLVVEQKSLKKASLKAKVTPSAVSQSIATLESAFGKPLLVRERGWITPTPEALSLLEIVRPAFEVFDRLRDLKEAPVPKISWINFGTYESLAVDLLPGLIHSLRTKLPRLRLGLRVSRTSHLLTMIRKGELCVALIPEVDNLSKFYVREVAQDRLGLFVSRRHDIVTSGWSAIEKYGYGSLAPGRDGLPRYFSKFSRQRGLERPTILSDSFESLRAAATGGSIVAILPHRVATRNDDLVEILPPKASSKESKELGFHRLYIISQANCDKEETDFLAQESSRLLGDKRNLP